MQHPSKTLAIMQPYFMPYIGYFQLLAAVDTFVIYDDVNFIKRGWIHRNNLLVNGQANLFSIPLAKASQNDLIHEVKLSGEWPEWRQKFLKTLEQNYRKAPHFEPTRQLMEQILFTDTDRISELATASIAQTAQYLGITTDIIQTSRRYANAHLKAQERIRAIALAEGATHYINPTGGMELYDRAYFDEAQIRLSFMQSVRQAYPQYKNEFVPWLSMIDVLMFNSPAEIGTLLQGYELV